MKALRCNICGKIRNVRSQRVQYIRGFCSKRCMDVSDARRGKKRNSNFYLSRAWRSLRYQTIKAQGRKCAACGTVGKALHVDHIKPISKYPELKLVASNLQVLCRDCNLGKSNVDQTDWRKESVQNEQNV